MKIKLCVAAALGVCSTVANAAPFGVYDARSAGMGSVGVASSHISSAPFFNPAMLAAQRHKDDFGLLLGLGVMGSDKDGLLDDVEAFNDAYDAGQPGDMVSAVDAADGKSLFVQANAAFAAGFSGINWSGALSANGYAQADTFVIEDTGTVQDSELALNGIEVSEVGLSLAHKMGAFSFGVTPKVVSVTSYVGKERLTDIEDLGDVIDQVTEQGEKDHGNSVNVDLGLVYKLSERWQLGLVHRNAISETYTNDTDITNITKFNLDPQTRAGVAYNGGMFTVGVDYDLIENDPLTAQGDKTQMLAAGAEMNVFDFLQLRAGYATNMADTGGSDLDQYSLGVGVKIIGVHMDVAAIGNENSVSAYAQAGVRF